MTTARTILRDSAIALVALTAGAGHLQGPAWVVPVLLGGLLSLGNLWLLTRIVGRTLSEVAAGGAELGTGLRFVTKFLLLLGLMVVLVKYFDAAPVALGFCSVFAGVALRGVIDLFKGGDSLPA